MNKSMNETPPHIILRGTGNAQFKKKREPFFSYLGAKIAWRKLGLSLPKWGDYESGESGPTKGIRRLLDTGKGLKSRQGRRIWVTKGLFQNGRQFGVTREWVMV